MPIRPSLLFSHITLTLAWSTFTSYLILTFFFFFFFSFFKCLSLGLRPHEIHALSSYVHFREHEPSHSSETLDSETREDFEASIDIFNSIEKDVPKGSWTVHQEGFSVVLSSLVWPGYYHYSTFLNGNYADIYCGTGKKNNDLGFML
ncbi:Radial spoke head protein 9 [Coelomomyces lativittatus]|nr:Radial spoke head protein 9 [Coelomomyces lativittatus]